MIWNKIILKNKITFFVTFLGSQNYICSKKPVSKSALMNNRLIFNFIDVIQEKRILMKLFWVLSCIMVLKSSCMQEKKKTHPNQLILLFISTLQNDYMKVFSKKSCMRLQVKRLLTKNLFSLPWGILEL